MAKPDIRIEVTVLNKIFFNLPPKFGPLRRARRTSLSHPETLSHPRDQYPVFEDLIIFLYSRWLTTAIPRSEIFSQPLSQWQKIHLGEAIDRILDLNLMPSSVNAGIQLSFWSLCNHERFGFRDDDRLLCAMFHIRAHILLDSRNGPREGERWKWYDHRLTIAIYSWVRHNQNYHGCSNASCCCHALVDQYGMTIDEFNWFYMAVQQQCINQLPQIHQRLIRFSAYSSAATHELYVEPIRKEWPTCLLSIAATPDPQSTQEATDSDLVSPMPTFINSSALQSAIGINASRINQSTRDQDRFQTIAATSPSSSQPFYIVETQEGLDEVISPKLDKEMEVGPSSFVDNEADASMEFSFSFQDTSPAKSDQLPDLSGLIAKVEPSAIFDGTYSTVFRGFYGDHEVAIKVIRGVSSLRSTHRKLRRELETWWHLSHPNILPLYGFVEGDGFGFGSFGAMVSPWCHNGNAMEYLAQGLTAAQRVGLFCDVAQGLQYLHELDPIVVHGDLKSANVLVTRDGLAQLCDFGLVRLIHDQTATGLTTTTAHTGTARYLSLELVEADEGTMPTTESDIWALGCVGMEFIYLQPPYSYIPTNLPNAHYKICREIGKGVSPATQPEDASGAISTLWSLFHACWHPNPADRLIAWQVSSYLHMESQNIVEAFGD